MKYLGHNSIPLLYQSPPNYTYTYTAGGQSASQAGPWINVDGPTYYGAIYPSSNAFYLAAEGLSGTGTWTIDLPEGVYLTVVIK